MSQFDRETSGPLPPSGDTAAGPPASPRADTSDPAMRRSWLGRSYIARHWRGELKLPVAYWINGVLANVTFIGLVFLLKAHSESDSFIPSIDLSLIIAFWIFALLLSVWQFVGIWRTAGRRLREGGHTLWPVLARIAISLSLLQGIVTFHNSAIPQMLVMAEILRGDPSLGPHVVRVLPNGVEAEYRGAITFGAAAELRALLDANPGVKVLHLNSIGGRVREARTMAALVRERGLTTTTATQCASACVLVFLAGHERYLAPGASLGFHRESFPGLSDEQTLQAEEADRVAMRSLGIPQDFIDRAFATASAKLWSPTPEELEKAHVIDGVSNAYAITGLDENDLPGQIDKIFSAFGAYQKIKDVDPADYGVLRNQLAAAIAKGASHNDVIAIVVAWTSPVFTKYAAHTSDEALSEFAKVLIKFLSRLARQDPDRCYYFLFPENTPPGLDVSSAFSRDEQMQMLDVEATVIADGAKRNLLIPDERDEAPVFAQLAQQIRAEDGDQALATLASLNSPNADHAMVCKVVIDLYTHVLTLPLDQRGSLLRYMLAQK